MVYQPMQRRVLAVAWLLSVGSFTGQCFASEVAIYGSVTDETGGGFPATVTLMTEDGKALQEVQAGMDGRYQFACLEDGVYSLRFEAEGFYTEVLSGIRHEYPQAIQVDRELILDKLHFRGERKILVIVLKDSAGRVLNDRAVTLRTSDGSVVAEGSTSPCGRIWFDVPAGSFGIEIEVSGSIEPFKETLEYDGGRSTRVIEVSAAN